MHFLIELALDRTVEGRERLAAQIGDFCSKENQVLTEQESDLISEILSKLLKEFETSIRQRLSERLARTRNTPHEVIVLLANDAIEVARPVLLESELLRDTDLIEVIRHRGRQHRLAVARRRHIPESVSEALVEAGETDVITSLLENQDARIAESTMAYLVEESRRVDSFQEPLVNRHDLSPELARKLCSWVGAALRLKILEQFDIDLAALDDALEGAIADVQSEDRAAAEEGETEDAIDAAGRLAHDIAARGPISGELMVRVLQRGEVPLFEALFAELCGLERRAALRVIYDTGGEGFAIACRAMQMAKQTFASLLMLSRADGKVMQPRDLSRAIKVFDSVSLPNARQVLLSWRRDEDYQDAIASLRKQSQRAGA